MTESSPKRAGARPRRADPGRRRRQPQPGGRQRRPARHRQGLRRRPDDAQPDRGRLLARSGDLGPLPRRARRPLRAQDDAAARHGALDPRLAAGRLRALDGVLFAARVLGGVAAGMAFPTTLALITALWSGNSRTRSIALWSAIGGAIASLGPLLSGALLEHFDWGSVFLVTLPLAAVALFMAWRYVPAHVNETTEPVDNLGGILSILLVAALVMGINLAPVPGKGTLAIGLGVVAIADGGCLRAPPATRALAALRPRGGGAADLLGRRLRRDHRLRLADGGDVHRPAVPAERARLLDRRLRPGDPAGGGADGGGRAALGQAGRGARRPLHPA